MFGEEGSSHSLYIHRLAVVPNYVGTGIGKGILRWIEENRESDKKYLKLDCVANHTKLHHFYESNGFEFLGITDVHSKFVKYISG
ncbi:GNAT family N-acetyltransferase [Bacillus cereus]|uniref:GNAT family N-acetyltransferase n=1 Tax=Bacillus cereus TaxID=1396 RepID=UPI003D32C5C4